MSAKKVWLAKLLLSALVSSAPVLANNEDQTKSPPRDDSGAVKVSHPGRVRLGGITAGAYYSRFSGPYYGGSYCGPYGYRPLFWNAWGPYCSPFFDLYMPLYHPGYYTGFLRGPSMGEVRLHTASKKAEVFLDGAYAGTAENLKSMWLEPGAYNLEVKAENRPAFSRRIYVLSGKTLKIDTALEGRP